MRSDQAIHGNVATTGIPWWWEAAPRQVIDHPLPTRCDIVIVGSGYTGLSAALTLLKAGKSVVIVEQGSPGEGASSRNGGMVGSGHKVGYADLKKRYGHDTALRILQEGIQSLKFTRELIQSENLDCHYEQCGRFRGAWYPKDYDRMARELDWMSTNVGLNASLVDRSSQFQEVAVERYYGGCIYHDHGSLHPGLFHTELLDRVINAGGVVSSQNPALSINQSEGARDVATLKGKVRTDQVIVATNGYRGALVSTWRRATVPASSFLIATEELEDGLAESLIPSGRMIVETRRLFGYYRLSPDRKRVILGGRASLQKIDTRVSGVFLTELLVGLFPQLRNIDISHSWTGYTAMTLDSVPHLATVEDGVTVVGGYNGSGVAMAPYLGYKAGQRLLDNNDGETVFADLPLPVIPLYTGNPWFLNPLNYYYRFLDRKDSFSHRSG